VSDYGDLLCSIRDGDVYIDRADPKICISDELLRMLRYAPGKGVSVDGDVLRIDAANRSVVYRIGAHDDALRCYYAEWPD